MGTHRSNLSSEAATDFSGAPGLSTSTAEDDVVVSIGSAAELHGQQPSGASEALGTSQEQPLDRFRRRLERFRGLGDAEIKPGSLDDESELRLQVMLLREENARLKGARHQPAGAGSAIDRIRLLNSQASGAATADDAWGLLTDCLVIREGLEQVCVEMQQAISTIQERLAGLTMSFEAARPTDELNADGAGSVGG
jgi:hypothetical protein